MCKEYKYSRDKLLLLTTTNINYYELIKETVTILVNLFQF